MILKAYPRTGAITYYQGLGCIVSCSSLKQMSSRLQKDPKATGFPAQRKLRGPSGIRVLFLGAEYLSPKKVNLIEL